MKVDNSCVHCKAGAPIDWYYLCMCSGAYIVMMEFTGKLADVLFIDLES